MRLKGGDPFVFGRGGEEALRCARPASRSRSCPESRRASPRPPTPGIPVTHREPRRRAWRSSPATRTPPRRRRRWTGPRSPRFPGTLVFYMGVRALPRIAEQLIAGGRDRPASRSRWSSAGRCPASGRCIGTLGDDRRRAPRDEVRAPAVTIVGRGRLAARRARGWSAARCAGARVAVTRARAQASALAARLRELGAAWLTRPRSAPSRWRRRCPSSTASTCSA